MTGEDKCKVSIICITYNQERYLIRAIESMLSQVTDFRYEIIIHDDVSTDRTREIIREYEKKYSDKIRAIYETENQYSQGVDFFGPIVTGVAKGKYIAVCEGDDFWIDNCKLQLQYEALEAHPECDMCACYGCTVTEEGNEEVSPIRPGEMDGILPVEDVIRGGGQFLVTAGLFFRKSMYDRMLPFEKIIPLDYAQQIKGALRGGIYYIDRKMAVYRRYASGSWTNSVLKDKERLRIQWDKEIALLKQLDIDTDGKYHGTIEDRLRSYIPFEEQLESHRIEILAALGGISGRCFIWGRGRRGNSLEAFCRKEMIKIDGICDVINTDIGYETEYGNPVVHTEDAIKDADAIFASNRYAYNDLLENGFKGKLIDFQEYMPWG